MIRSYYKLVMAIIAFALSPYAFDGMNMRNRFGHEFSPFWTGVICIIIGVYFFISFIQ